MYKLYIKLQCSSNSRNTLSSSSYFYLTNSIIIYNVSAIYGSGLNSTPRTIRKTKSLSPKVAYIYNSSILAFNNTLQIKLVTKYPKKPNSASLYTWHLHPRLQTQGVSHKIMRRCGKEVFCIFFHLRFQSYVLLN